MDESAVLPGPPAGSPVHRPGTGPRKLSEGIFPSAEEAVLAEQAYAAGSFPSGAPAVAQTDDKQAFLMRSLRTQVAAHPCRSALMAAAAGALAMIMLRSQWRRRAGPRQRRWAK
jgi:hypothetical protein